MEINPFHNGHKYFLNQIPRREDDILIVITSTNLCQRGEFSVLNKKNKTEILLDNNVDIVVELPALFANQAADYFAFYAISILDKLNVTDLYFGSEKNNIKLLEEFQVSDNKDYKNGYLKEELSSFQSNDILGIAYLKAIKQIKSNIKAHTILRINNAYNDTNITGEISSATSIRNNALEYDLIKNTMPKKSLENMLKIDEDLALNLFKVNLYNVLDNDIMIFMSLNNQLLIRLQKTLASNKNINSIEVLASLAADKNNSKHKYKRIIMNTILMITEQDYSLINYINILGFNLEGQKHIKALNCDLIVSTLKNINCEVAKVEKRSSQIYDIITKTESNIDFSAPIIYRR